jgi:hypothetical protein
MFHVEAAPQAGGLESERTRSQALGGVTYLP